MEDIVDFSPSRPSVDRARIRPPILAVIAVAAALTATGYLALTRIVSAAPPIEPPTEPPIPVTTSALARTICVCPAPALTISPGAPSAALAAIPVRDGTVSSGTTEVIGDATGPVGFAAIAGPGRYVVDLLCLGRGVISVTIGDPGIFLDESMHSPTVPTTRIPCADRVTAPVSAEVEIAGTSLAVRLDPDPATVGAIAWRISPA